MKRINSLFVNQLSASTYLNFIPLRIALFIISFARSIFGHGVCLFPLTEYLAVMFGLATAAKFLGAHPVIALLALLSDDVEIEKKLRHSVGDSHAETLEPPKTDL